MKPWTLKAWTVALGAYGVVALAAVLLIYLFSVGARAEILKIFVEFLLVTAGGAILVAWLTMRRDEDQRELARQAAVRELARDVNAGYRRFKIVKRRLRSQILREEGRGAAYRFEAAAFEASMEQLLEAQIAFELIRDTVGARSDLLAPEAIERIHDALDYAARYFHDVYQDYENGCVIRRDGRYEAGTDCAGLADFVGRRAWTPDPAAPWVNAIDSHFRALRDEDANLAERYRALRGIIALRDEDKARRRESLDYRREVRPIRRYRIVATEAIGLAFLDIQKALPAPRSGAPATAGLAAPAGAAAPGPH